MESDDYPPPRGCPVPHGSRDLQKNEIRTQKDKHFACVFRKNQIWGRDEMPHGSQMLSPRCNSRIVRITGRWDDAWFSTGLRILKNLKIRTQKLSDFACVFGILAVSEDHGSRHTRAPTHFTSNLHVLSRKSRKSSPEHLISRLGGFLSRFCVRIS